MTTTAQGRGSVDPGLISRVARTPGSHRRRVTEVLFRHVGQAVPLDDLHREVYGEERGGSTKVLNVLTGLRLDLQREGETYEVRSVRMHGRPHVGLYPLGAAVAADG